MIKDKPLLGHGIGGFAANYMNYQAQYFRQHPDSRYAMLAGNVHHPLNEYLLMLANYGVIGFTLFIALVYGIWILYRRRSRDDLSVRVAELSLCAVLLFSLFSYPLSYPFVWVSVIVSVSVIVRDRLTVNRTVGILMATASIVILALTYNNMHYQLRWGEAARQAQRGSFEDIKQEYMFSLKKFAENRYFLYNCAYELQAAGQFLESQNIADRCRSIWADYYLELMIADNCCRLGRNDESIEHYKQAAEMCPVRFIPLYRMVVIFRANGQIDQAKELARQIVNKQVKIPSPTIDAIVHEMKQFLESR